MAEIEVLTDMWAEELEDMTVKEICLAISRHRRSSVYFPTIAEIRELCIEARQELGRSQKGLPFLRRTISETERQKNMEYVGKILKMLSRKKAI